MDGDKSMLINGGALFVARQHLQAAFDNHIAYNKLSRDLRDANSAAYWQAFWLLVSCMVVVLLVCGGLGTQLYRLIASGLNNIQRTLQQVSQSLDLTQTAKVERMDEIGHTAKAFNALLARVAEVIGEVRGSSGSVSVASSAGDAPCPRSATAPGGPSVHRTAYAAYVFTVTKFASRASNQRPSRSLRRTVSV
jgi:methyl-accepting chemotaxis protein